MNSKLLLPKGIYYDRIITGGSRIIDLGWRSNIIVDRCRHLLAAFMKGDSAVGIRLLGIGRGLENWDAEPPEPPSRADEQLTDPEPFKIKIDPAQIMYLDAAGNLSEKTTNRIGITITLDPGDPPIEAGETTYPLREFGLFGTFGEDEEEYMIDYVRHPVIHKRADDTLVRTIRLVF